MAARKKAPKPAATPKPKRGPLRSFNVGALPVNPGRLTPAAAQRWLCDELPGYQDFAQAAALYLGRDGDDRIAVGGYLSGIDDMTRACAEAIRSGRAVRIERPGLDDWPLPWERAASQLRLLALAAMEPGEPMLSSETGRVFLALLGDVGAYLETEVHPLEAERRREANADTNPITRRERAEKRREELRERIEQMEKLEYRIIDEIAAAMAPVLGDKLERLRYEKAVAEHELGWGPKPKPPAHVAEEAA